MVVVSVCLSVSLLVNISHHELAILLLSTYSYSAEVPKVIIVGQFVSLSASEHLTS